MFMRPQVSLLFPIICCSVPLSGVVSQKKERVLKTNTFANAPVYTSPLEHHKTNHHIKNPYRLQKGHLFELKKEVRRESCLAGGQWEYNYPSRSVE